jgi:mediator of RNA polymerase II transcription subunit 5
MILIAGLDLFEPFLVPALVAVIEWMMHEAFKRKPDLKFTAQLLSRLFQLSPERTSMYQTVITIMSFSIDRFMRKISGMGGKIPEWLENVKSSVQPHIDFRRTIYSPFTELQSLRASQSSLKIAFRSSVQSLVMWSVSAAATPIQQPVSYAPQMFYVSLLILGPRCVLQILLEEIKARTSEPDGSAAVALDIATTFICSPTPGSAQSPPDWTHNGPSMRNGRESLREALRLWALEAPKLLATDQIMAETVVRLHRRVEALLQMTLNSITNLSATLVPHLADMDESAAAAVDLAAAAVVENMDFTAAGNDFMADAGMMLDLNQTVGEATGMDVLGSGTGEDDIFGGLLTAADMTDIELNY